MGVEAKILGRFFFKNKSATNIPCKTYVWVYDNGVTVINQLFLVDGENDNNPAWTKLCTKFGKTLYVVSVSFKYSSMMNIINTSTQILQSNNVKPQDLLS